MDTTMEKWPVRKGTFNSTSLRRNSALNVTGRVKERSGVSDWRVSDSGNDSGFGNTIVSIVRMSNIIISVSDMLSSLSC